MNRRARSRPLRLGLFCRGRARHGECPGARLWCTGIGARSPGIGVRWGSKALCKKGHADLTNSPVSLNPGLLGVLVCDDVARLERQARLWACWPGWFRRPGLIPGRARRACARRTLPAALARAAVASQRPSLLVLVCSSRCTQRPQRRRSRGGGRRGAPCDCCSRLDRERSPCAGLWLCIRRCIRRLLCYISYIVY